MEERIVYLEEQYPFLAILVMKKRGMKNRVDVYMEQCKTYRKNARKYSLYIHGYLLPWFQLQREAGKLRQGKF